MSRPQAGAVVSFSRSSVLDASVGVVWDRVTRFDGVNHELMPWMRMTPPRRYRSATIESVPLDVPLGRVLIWYLGFLPLDYDEMSFTELLPGAHFQERSTMRFMRSWGHHRAVAAVDEGRTRLTDTIEFEPRPPLASWPLERILRGLFAHRHRRLITQFRRW